MKILVGVDESDMSKHAVQRALQLAERLDAEVEVAHAAYIPATVLAAMGGVPMNMEDIVTGQRRAVWAGLESVLGEAKVPVTRVDLDGYPPDALTDHAGNSGADLIVVGTRGRGPIASMVLGSTSHRVVNNAPCDVLVVRPRGER
jgi:nucleotide-binding universal stress UspA family protein